MKAFAIILRAIVGILFIGLVILWNMYAEVIVLVVAVLASMGIAISFVYDYTEFRIRSTFIRVIVAVTAGSIAGAIIGLLLGALLNHLSYS